MEQVRFVANIPRSSVAALDRIKARGQFDNNAMAIVAVIALAQKVLDALAKDPNAQLIITSPKFGIIEKVYVEGINLPRRRN